MGPEENKKAISHYGLGSYGNDLAEGTMRFIQARLLWAEKVIERELAEKEALLKAISSLKLW